MDVRDFDFDLPSELIAQEPPAERGAARMLYVERGTGALIHSTVAHLPGFLRPGDVLVVNNTRVFPARLLGHRVPSGGAVECLLVAPVADDERPASAVAGDGECWHALMHPGQKLRPGARVRFGETPVIHGEVIEWRFQGRRVIRLWTDDGAPIDTAVDAIGHVPLPPYIKREDRLEDRDRYQTLFARRRGSVAAPTAGLHFTPELTRAIRQLGVEIVEITLHVGYGTFQPVRVEKVEDHRIEPERFAIGDEAARSINCARLEGRRVVAVGTTTTRALEAVAAAHDGKLVPGEGTTSLFIFPGFDFRVVGGLLTNFHLPQSSLLMLVSAFGGYRQVIDAYAAAITERYRFYSYGDAMLIA
jgi:S-adenosylmethionine:tRNA ribosyltransferase-isomerase